MTEGAPCGLKHASASRNRFCASRRIGRRRRRRQETREKRKLFDRAQHAKRRLATEVGHVIRNCRKLACWSFIALRLEELVGDTHFDVVRLAGEQEEGFVLRLPSEP